MAVLHVIQLRVSGFPNISTLLLQKRKENIENQALKCEMKSHFIVSGSNVIHYLAKEEPTLERSHRASSNFNREGKDNLPNVPRKRNGILLFGLFVFFLKVASTPSMGLELTTLR